MIENKDMFTAMKEALNSEVQAVRFTHRLKNHPVCLTTEGEISSSMQKVLNALPNEQKVNANMVMEINENHPIAAKLQELYKNNKEELENYT